MPGYFLNNSQEAVRYKTSKHAGEEDQDAEILIPSRLEENTDAAEGKKEKWFSQLKIFLYLVSIFTTLLILFVALYYYNIFSHSNNAVQSFSGSCTPLQKVEEVIIVSERTDYKSCSDNKTCHEFLDAIENQHDGSKYNFVIGSRGELYIGAGFKCLVNSTRNALYVKFLIFKHPEAFDEYMYKCLRLSEIIEHGILCGKISSTFQIEDKSVICASLEGEDRWHHVHDPAHEVKLIHEDVRWTICGDFSTANHTKKGKVIALESLPKHSCSPLKLVDKVEVDVEESSPLECSAFDSCLREYDEHHEGYKYNFILSNNLDIFVGLGYRCRADTNSSNILRIKVLVFEDNLHSYSQFYKYLQILEEGYDCGKFSDKFSVTVNCNITIKEHNGCKFFQHIEDIEEFKMILEDFKPEYDVKNSTINSDGVGLIVPERSRYRFCHRNHSQVTTTLSSVSTDTDTTTGRAIVTTDAPCVSFKHVDKVRVIIEKTNYSCSDNASCPSLLDIIEKDHDGLSYNFVIGPNGELYIGTGFKCIANIEENSLYVKLLVNEATENKKVVRTLDVFEISSQSPVCSRLFDILHQGKECGKISPNFTTVSSLLHNRIPSGDIVYNTTSFVIKNTNIIDKFIICPLTLLKDKMYNNHSSHHLHLPDYQTQTLIPGNTRWTLCDDLLNRTSTNNDEEKAQGHSSELLSNHSCPYQLDKVEEVTIDIVSASSWGYGNTCLPSIESNYHNVTNFNFIIDRDNVCVGLGYNCRPNLEENILKILVLKSPEESHQDALSLATYEPFLQIIEGGLACTTISQELAVTIDCEECLYQVQNLKIRSNYYFIYENLVFQRRNFYYESCPSDRSGELMIFPPKVERRYDRYDYYEEDDEPPTYGDRDYAYKLY